MKVRYLILFVAFITLEACSDDCGCTYPTFFPSFQVLSLHDSTDLLNPAVDGSIKEWQIGLWTIDAGNKETLQTEINRNGSNSTYYLSVSNKRIWEFMGQTGNRDYYLKLDALDVDTITLSINADQRIESIAINGELLELADLQQAYIVLYK